MKFFSPAHQPEILQPFIKCNQTTANKINMSLKPCACAVALLPLGVMANTLGSHQRGCPHSSDHLCLGVYYQHLLQYMHSTRNFGGNHQQPPPLFASEGNTARGRCRLGDINCLCIPYFSEADELLLTQAIYARGGIETVAEIACDLSKVCVYFTL